MTKGLLRIALLCLLAIAWAIPLQAQYYSSGQDPASVDFRQIKTKNFRIIFPDSYQPTAQYVANVMEYAAALDTITLSDKPPSIPIILHNQTAISNAMTVWAPRRMDFYTIPPTDSYGQEWFQQLALHEYRHIVQIDKLNQGLTRALTYIFGEQATGAVLGLYVPLWFLEGDAVAAETELSNTGRGRSPAFAMPLRAQFLQRGIYTYDKAVFGSYRDFTPNRYILGYHLVATGRRDYGTELWNHTLDKVGRRPYMIVPFSEGIREVTQKNKTTFYRDQMEALKVEWEQASVEMEQPFEEFPLSEKQIFTDYKKPFYFNKINVVAEKRPLDEIARFVAIDSAGNEEVLFTPGYYDFGSLAYGGGRLAWSERVFDPRWENRNFSVIKILDLKSKIVKTIAEKTRWFSPALSSDGELLVVTEVTEDQRYQLLVMQVDNGKIVQSIATPNYEFLTTPAFSDNSENIVAVAIGDAGNRLVLAETTTGDLQYLMDTTFTVIGQPSMRGDTILFVGAWSGVDNLCMLLLPSREIFQITDIKYGAANPSFCENENKIIFENYTADGFEIATLRIDSIVPMPLSLVTDRSVKLYQTLAEQADTLLVPAHIPDSAYTIHNYSRLGHLFNFHSWAPVAIDVDNYEVKPGVSLFSQNVLSTAFAELGWEYNLNEETGKYYTQFTYAGWYPVVDFSASYGRRRSSVIDTASQRIDFNWMETNFATTVRVPLNITRGKWARFVQPSVTLEYVQRDMDADAAVSFRRSNYKALTYRLSASNQIKSTDWDMYPRWGQTVDLRLQSSPFAGDTLGAMFSVVSRLYFPGLWRHHSFNFYAGYQKRADSSPLYEDMVRFPRGWSQLYASEVSSFSANYKFPVAYPDFSAWSLVYLKRIKANVFFDYALGTHYGDHTDWQSAGVELFADVHLLRLPAPVELGYRLVYRPQVSDWQSEFLFSVSFDSF
ncbi:MAG: hypothetical protein EOM83_05525 [Clostridia bacterium]|nr:hypothetical protein [Clostridia bacterium]